LLKFEFFLPNLYQNEKSLPALAKQNPVFACTFNDAWLLIQQPGKLIKRNIQG
jgi:hypothetical protein